MQLQAVLAGARAVGIPVLHVGLAFRPGYPELDPRSPMLARLQGSGRLLRGSPSAEFDASVAPRPDEARITKFRVSAFAGNELAMMLRARRIETLVLLGVATSGVVLSTVRQASDLDFQSVVVRDACADADVEVHRVLMDKVFPRQAQVVASKALLA